MHDPNLVPDILSGANVVLLGVIGFFLRSLHLRFETLEKDVRGTLVASAVESQRIVAIEKDLSELKQIVMSTIFKTDARKA